MYALRKDTLAGIRQSSLFEPRKITVALPSMVERLNAYMNTHDANTKSEIEALRFYFANHVFSLIAQRYAPHEPLPEAVYALARGYVKIASDVAARLVYYTLMITAREARHFPGPESLLSTIIKETGVDFFKVKYSGGEEGILSKLRKHPPTVPLSEYLRANRMVFNDSAMWSGSYGGPKWGNIVEQLLRLVQGETSAETFADTAFTLAHNGGPMFNKSMLYDDVDKHTLYKILDVQRSGQIPQLVPHEVPTHLVLPGEFLDYAAAAKKVFPADLGGYVDWFKVEGLGALNSYPSEKAAQVKKYGNASASAAEKKLAAVAAKLAAEQAAKEAAEAAAAAILESKKFYVGTGENDYAVIEERLAA